MDVSKSRIAIALAEGGTRAVARFASRHADLGGAGGDRTQRHRYQLYGRRGSGGLRTAEAAEQRRRAGIEHGRKSLHVSCRLGGSFAACGRDRLDFRIGVHFGPAILSRLGSPTHQQITVVCPHCGLIASSSQARRRACRRCSFSGNARRVIGKQLLKRRERSGESQIVALMDVHGRHDGRPAGNAANSAGDRISAGSEAHVVGRRARFGARSSLGACRRRDWTMAASRYWLRDR